MLLASVAIAGCGKKRKPNDSLNATVETALYDEGLLLIERMKKLTHDTGFVNNLGLPRNANDLYEKLLACPYDNLKDVYRVSHLEDATNTFVTISGEKMDDYSSPFFKNRVTDNMSSMVIGYLEGATELSVASLLMQEECFVNTELLSCEVYIYCYEDSYPVMVSFSPGKGGAVKARATYLLSDSLINISPEELGDAIRGYFNATSLECITQ